MADCRPAAGQSDVYPAGRRFGRIERGPAPAELLFDFLLEFVGGLAEDRLEISWRRGHRLHQRGDEAVFSSEVFVAEGLKIRFRGNTRRVLLELGAESGNVGIGRHTRRGLRGPWRSSRGAAPSRRAPAAAWRAAWLPWPGLRSRRMTRAPSRRRRPVSSDRA